MSHQEEWPPRRKPMATTIFTLILSKIWTMKRRLLIGFATFISVLLGTNARAQTVTVTPNPSGTSGNIVVGTANYHASEYIYKESEIGALNFTSAPITYVAFAAYTVGPNPTFDNVKIYMQNVPLGTTTFSTGAYSLTGYTLVYSGSMSFPTANEFSGVFLQTPFLRVAGTNLQVLIERSDNLTHPNFVFYSSNDGSTPTNTSRRYNGTTALQPDVTSLTASTFRATIQLVNIGIDASITSVVYPTVSCYDAPQTVSLVLKNGGSNPIAAGAATVSYRVGGTNTFVGSKTNTGILAAGASETIQFTGINLPNPGFAPDSAIVVLAGDQNSDNDTILNVVVTAPVVPLTSSAPVIEDAEGSYSLLLYPKVLAGTRQLWDLHNEPPKYKNTDLTDSLGAHGGTAFFLFDGWSGASSAGSRVLLYSHCVALPPATNGCGTNMSFFMSHDNSYPTDLDSMYVNVSTDKGATWTRLAGFGRVDAAALVPTWKMETVSLSAYSGQTVQIGFEGVSKYGNVIGLDDITISTNCVVPIDLLSFTATNAGEKNDLKWTTATENNNAGFEVQRSNDGVNFQKIGYVASKANGGSSHAKLNYVFSDRSPLSGNNYYRLNQIDRDGKSNHSGIEVVKGMYGASIVFRKMYPNPGKTSVSASIDAARNTQVTFVFTDLAGRTVKQYTAAVVAGSNNIPLNVRDLASGNYVVKIICAEGCETSFQKFLKE
jgi:hypothetical protein